MPERERRPSIPAWAERERTSDLLWIAENLESFWQAAQAGYADQGRGAIGVDTTAAPTVVGHPFGYLTQAQIGEYGGRDEMRMVATYDPTRELVIILLKAQGRVSSYRVGLPPGARPATPRQ
jgi:hypothetical protein